MYHDGTTHTATPNHHMFVLSIIVITKPRHCLFLSSHVVALILYTALKKRLGLQQCCLIASTFPTSKATRKEC